MRLPLKIAIVKSGKTQRQLSLECAIVETRLSNIVRGRDLPTVRERTALAGALSCSAEDLFA
jgi:hypothetical protein